MNFFSIKKFNRLVIRFRRKGHKRYPVFEIVLIKQNSRNRGRAIEKLGFYNPNFFERLFFINVARLAYWRNRGAYVNFNVKKYLVKFLA